MFPCLKVKKPKDAQRHLEFLYSLSMSELSKPEPLKAFGRTENPSHKFLEIFSFNPDCDLN